MSCISVVSSESDMRVGIGNNVVDKMTQFYNVKKIFRNKYYDKKTLVNDIALLELDNTSNVIPRGTQTS